MESIYTVSLPDIGEGVVEGEVVEWLKKEGEALSQDEPVVVVMTDKATVELPAPYPGKLAKQHISQGGIAVKGKPLYDIALASSQEVPTEDSGSFAVRLKDSVPLPEKKEQMAGKKALAAPPVRKVAKDLGIDIHTIQGTGKKGEVTIEDIKQVATHEQFPPPHLTDDEEIPWKGIKGLMAKKMAASKRTIPHFSFHEKAEAKRLVKLRQSFKQQGEKEGVAVTFLPFFLRALSLTIRAFPVINSSFEPETNRLLIHKQQNIGIAMAQDDGLIVPVLKGVQQMDLAAVIRGVNDLKAKAAAKQLTSADMKDSTITISNYGSLGDGLWATPIINVPEVAILALNKIHKEAVVKNDEIVVVDLLNMSWSFDHRVIDGELAAKVSHHFGRLIENPAALL